MMSDGAGLGVCDDMCCAHYPVCGFQISSLSFSRDVPFFSLHISYVVLTFLVLISTISLVVFFLCPFTTIFSLSILRNVLQQNFPCILGCWIGLTESLPSFFARTRQDIPTMDGRQTRNEDEKFNREIAIILLNVFNSLIL